MNRSGIWLQFNNLRRVWLPMNRGLLLLRMQMAAATRSLDEPLNQRNNLWEFECDLHVCFVHTTAANVSCGAFVAT